MTSKLRIPKQKNWSQFYVRHNPTTDGSDYNIIFRNEGNKEQKIQDCIEDIYLAFKRQHYYFVSKIRRKKKAREMIKKFGLNEKHVLNIMKI